MTPEVRTALALWGIADANVALAAQRENVVYRVETPGKTYALRFHRPGYRSQDELRSELQWLDVLGKAGMSVPAPCVSLSGRLLEQVADTPVDVLVWLDGKPLGQAGQLEGISDRPAFCHELGKTLADLHRISDAWERPAEFTRPSWDRNGLLGDAPLWGVFWEHPGLASSERDMLYTARARANRQLEDIEPDLDFGLIHADCLSENLMHDSGYISLLDFDDGGFGFREFELATFLLRFLAAPDYSELSAALFDGFGRIPDPDVMELFLMLRAFTYVGWIIPRLSEPGGADRSRRSIATALPLVETYLGKSRTARS